MDAEFSKIGRRRFLAQGILAGTTAGVAGITIFGGCKESSAEQVTPTEDLMREHGVLRRVMLFYDHCKILLASGQDCPFDLVGESAGIIRNFIEGYHEKLEEEHLFPMFRKAGKLKELVDTLQQQHAVGRTLTGRIIAITAKQPASNEDKVRLATLLDLFTRMYRPHAAREDTVLFPALKEIVRADEYEAMGEDFEDVEMKLLGRNGFEGMVEKIAEIEKRSGLYDLTAFTSVLPEV